MTPESEQDVEPYKPEEAVRDYFEALNDVGAHRAKSDDVLAAEVERVAELEAELHEARKHLTELRASDPAWHAANERAAHADDLKELILSSWDDWWPGVKTPDGLGVQRRTTKGIHVEDAIAAVDQFHAQDMLGAALDLKKLASVFKAKFVRELLDGGVAVEGIEPEDRHTLADVRPKQEDA